MEKFKPIKIILFILVSAIAGYSGLWLYGYAPQQQADTFQLKADSLLSVKLKLEEELQRTKTNLEKVRAQNVQLSEKLLRSKQRNTNKNILTNDDLKKNLKEMAGIISNYQSQMRSLIIANEKLEKQVETLAGQLP
jgi:hypothetical protein